MFSTKIRCILEDTALITFTIAGICLIGGTIGEEIRRRRREKEIKEMFNNVAEDNNVEEDK